MTSTIEIEVPGTTPGDFDYINVEFSVETYVEDDTITVDGQTYGHGKTLEADGDPTWSRLKHTKWENDAITAYLLVDGNIGKISDELVALQLEEYANAEYDSYD